ERWRIGNGIDIPQPPPHDRRFLNGLRPSWLPKLSSPHFRLPSIITRDMPQAAGHRRLSDTVAPFTGTHAPSSGLPAPNSQPYIPPPPGPNRQTHVKASGSSVGLSLTSHPPNAPPFIDPSVPPTLPAPLLARTDSWDSGLRRPLPSFLDPEKQEVRQIYHT